MRALILGAKNLILDLLFPKKCLGCGTEGLFLCEMCGNKLLRIAPKCFVCKKLVPASGQITPGRTCVGCQKKTDIYAFFSPFSYDDPLIRTLIHSLKYQRAKSIAPVLGELLEQNCRYFGFALPRDVVIIPIPLHPKKHRVRGFNQSEAIAASLMSSYGKPKVDSVSLQRVRHTNAQVELTGEERRKNMENAFECKEKIAAKSVILVDDVRTTGATLEAAAMALKKAGVKKIWALTVAH